MISHNCGAGNGFAGNILAFASKEQPNKNQMSTCLSEVVNIFFLQKCNKIEYTNCIFVAKLSLKKIFYCFDNCQQIVTNQYLMETIEGEKHCINSNIKLGNVIFMHVIGCFQMRKKTSDGESFLISTASPLQHYSFY